MHQRDTLYINGNWVAPSGQGKIEVNEASTEQVTGSIPEDDADAPSGLDQHCSVRPAVLGRLALFGARRQSGNGREPGRHRLDQFHHYQSLQYRAARSA